MASFGYTLSSEEHPPKDLVRNARRGEEAGFDLLSISVHFHPWVRAQGHGPFVWSVLGGIAAVTERVAVGVGVTCPILRVHPAIVAHASATTPVLFDGRFLFGVGSREALDEHVFGHRWPPADVRLEMLEEAVEVIRALWSGKSTEVLRRARSARRRCGDATAPAAADQLGAEGVSSPLGAAGTEQLVARRRQGGLEGGALVGIEAGEEPPGPVVVVAGPTRRS